MDCLALIFWRDLTNTQLNYKYVTLGLQPSQIDVWNGECNFLSSSLSAFQFSLECESRIFFLLRWYLFLRQCSTSFFECDKNFFFEKLSTSFPNWSKKEAYFPSVSEELKFLLTEKTQFCANSHLNIVFKLNILFVLTLTKLI